MPFRNLMVNVLFEVAVAQGKNPGREEREAAPLTAASTQLPPHAGAWRKGRRSSFAPDAATETRTLTASASAATKQPAATVQGIRLESVDKNGITNVCSERRRNQRSR